VGIILCFLYFSGASGKKVRWWGDRINDAPQSSQTADVSIGMGPAVPALHWNSRSDVPPIYFCVKHN
jgi:hypothetical protein